jgi:hypothetical protein
MDRAQNALFFHVSNRSFCLQECRRNGGSVSWILRKRYKRFTINDTGEFASYPFQEPCWENSLAYLQASSRERRIWGFVIEEQREIAREKAKAREQRLKYRVKIIISQTLIL